MTAGNSEAVRKLWVEYKKNPTPALRNRLMEIYMPIVKHNAERIRTRLPGNVEIDDLLQVGAIGLMDAINGFDIDRGVKFETFCSARVCGAILDGLRSMDWVPRQVRTNATKMKEKIREMEGVLGRMPLDTEIAEELGMPLDEVQRIIRDTQMTTLTSLDKRWDQANDSSRNIREIDVLVDKRSEDPGKKLQNSELIRVVTKGLSQSERLIIILYYYENLTMREIGLTLNLSESRVSQMHTSIMRRLQDQLANRKSELAPN